MVALFSGSAVCLLVLVRVAIMQGRFCDACDCNIHVVGGVEPATPEPVKVSPGTDLPPSGSPIPKLDFDSMSRPAVAAGA